MNKTMATLVVCQLLLLGCGAQLATTARTDGATPVTLQPKPDRALVLFVGKSFRTAWTSEADEGVRIADDQGRVVGELAPENWMVADVEPGRRCWYAWLNLYAGRANVAAMCGTIEAGRRYVVRVGQRNFFTAGGALQPTWQQGTLLDTEQQSSLGRVYDAKLAAETQRVLADRIAQVVRDGEVAVTEGTFFALGERGF